MAPVKHVTQGPGERMELRENNLNKKERKPSGLLINVAIAGILLA
jgi:hypothetical protein